MVPVRDELALAVAIGAVVYLVTLATVERIAFPEDARAVWHAVSARFR